MAEIASAFVTIAPSARGFGSKLNSEVGSGVRTAGSSLGRTFGKLFVAGAGILAAAGIGSLLSGSIDEAREAQKVGAQTDAALKSTGGVANVTAGQIGKLSAALSAKIGVDDEAIQAGQNMLLTFTNVRNEVGKGNDIFNQATRTASDMAAAFGGDATSNSKILGKALNDPIKGVSALTRVGVSFTDGQKAQIKAMVESGDTLGAQKIILKELGKETKGSAEAQATAGDKASVALGNLKETIGTALLPVIDRLANTFTTVIAPAITTFVGQLQSGEGAGGKVATIFAKVGAVLGAVFGFIANNKTVTAVFIGSIVAMTVAFAAFNLVVSANPISLVIIAIAGLIAGLVYAYKHSETFRKGVDALWAGIKVAFTAIKKIVLVAVGFIKDHWRLLIVILGGPIGLAVALITKHWDKIKAGAKIVIDWVRSNWPAIKALITGPFTVAKDVIGKVWTALRQGASRAKDVVVKVFDGIKSAIQSVVDKVQYLIDKIGSLISKAKNIKLPHIPGLRTSSGESLAAAAVGGTKDEIAAAYGIAARAHSNGLEKVTKAVKEKVNKLRDALSTLKQDFASLVDPIASAFTGNLFEATTAKDFVASLTGTSGQLSGLIGAFKTLIGQGLNPKFLYDLFQSGNAGLILDLAANPALATQAGGLFGDINQLSTQLGQAVAGATPDGKAITAAIDKTNAKLDKLIKATHDGADRTGDVINGAAGAGHRRGKRGNGGRRAA